MKHQKKHVWYASYGSNLNRQRFLCYLKGRSIKTGCPKDYSGCEDKSEPLDERPKILPHELYFAKSSKTWGGGGVAFLGHKSHPSHTTYAKMYKITDEQFVCVYKQENGLSLDCKIKVNLDNVIKRVLLHFIMTGMGV